MVKNTDIFLGSGASITKIPEYDILFKSEKVDGNAFNDTVLSTIQAHADFENNFSMVNNIYTGCLLERYNSSKTLLTTHRIKSNTENRITFTPSVAPASGDFFVIKAYGAPIPAPKITGGSPVHTDLVTTITFNSDTKADYNDDAFVLNLLSAETAGGGTAAIVNVFFDITGSATYGGGGTTAQVNISNAADNTREEYAAVFTSVVNGLTNATATRDGATVTITSVHGGSNATATTHVDLAGAGKSSSTFTFSSVVGTTTTPTSAKRLLSDTWLGITESITFPTTEIEPKQVNLSLGNTRNKTYQYKGIETASGGSLNIIANHGAWLYYFLGAMTSVSATTNGSSNPSDDFTGASGKVYLPSTVSSTGPFFFRTVGTTGAGTVLCPPNPDHLHEHTTLDEVTLPSGTTTLVAPITYTIAEENGDNLPSFSLEQTLSKLLDPAGGTTNRFRTETSETHESFNFVKIARGCRVNTLTITANENEEVKMTAELNTRTVHSLESNEGYDGRRGVNDETQFFNYESTTDNMREPFFFSDGTFSIFGESFLKINSLTLTMNNNLQDRRFLGVGSTSIQEAIPAERTYELQFTGHVTDDRLYQELLNRTENTGATEEINLTFSKSNGESIVLKFQDYMLTANNYPIPDDKGPLVVESTVMPRNLAPTNGCVVTTHWKL